MNLYHVHLNSDKIALVSVTGEKGANELVGEKYDWDFVVRAADEVEKLRVNRENVLYVLIERAPEKE